MPGIGSCVDGAVVRHRPANIRKRYFYRFRLREEHDSEGAEGHSLATVPSECDLL